MQATRTNNLFLRNDTMLGVCEALGQDFGFNPIFLRLTLAVLLVPFPVQVIAAYLAAGVVVAFSRLLFPNPRRKPEAPVQPEARAVTNDAVELAEAA